MILLSIVLFLNHFRSQTHENKETKEWREGSHEKKQYSMEISIL